MIIKFRIKDKTSHKTHNNRQRTDEVTFKIDAFFMEFAFEWFFFLSFISKFLCQHFLNW